VAALGDQLRQARENKGLSLEQVEEVTHIRRAFLQALEEERFDALPGDVYVKGFLRNYARFLNLNPEEIMAAYNTTNPAITGSGIPQVLNEPLMHSGGSSGRMYALAAIAAVILGLAAWIGYSHFYRGVDVWPLNLILGSISQASGLPTTEPTEAVPAVDEQTIEPSPTLAVEETAPAETTTEAVEQPTATPTPTLRPTNTRRPTVEPSATPTTGPNLTPTQATSILVEARILATSYVRVMADGELLMERNLRVGDDQIWTANESLSIRVGNGAGIELTVNGVTVPALGAQGEVVDVTYTMDTLPTPTP
jgi:cytoskeleton protein RodZ